jgi:internalin A
MIMKTIAATFAIIVVAGLADLKVGTTTAGTTTTGTTTAGIWSYVVPTFRSALHVGSAVYAAADDALVASIEKQGGHVIRDANGNIVEVSLARTWATDADVEKLAGIKTLKKLDLSLTYVSDVGAEAIATLTQLEELNLFTAEFITDAAVAFLRSNTNLRVLNLRGTDVTDTSLEYVSRLGNLRSLDISFTQIGDVGMEHLAPLSQLEELNVGGTKISGAALHVLKYLPSLKRLSFYGTQRRNAGMCWAPVMTDIELDTIALLTGLEELNIGDGVALGAPKPAELGAATGEADCRITGGTRITDFGVAKLANLKKLRYLNLSGSVVTAGALKTLAALPNLQRLSLWNATGINDESAAAFASLQSLTSLDVSNTGIGDRTLASLAKLPRLDRLYISDTAVTADGVATFKQQRPSTAISWGVRPEPREPLVGSTKPRGAYTE